MSARVRVRRCRSQLHAQPCFHGYCAACGQGLSYYDDTAESCLAISLAALDKGEHVCKPKPKPPPSGQQELFA